MLIWGPISLSHVGGRRTSSLAWLPNWLLYPLSLLSFSCPRRPGCGRGPLQPYSSGTPETTQQVRHGGPWDEGLKGLGRWSRCWWALTCHFGNSLKHWGPVPAATRAHPQCAQVGCRGWHCPPPLSSPHCASRWGGRQLPPFAELFGAVGPQLQDWVEALRTMAGGSHLSWQPTQHREQLPGETQLFLQVCGEGQAGGPPVLL